jgi:hypothetical protein
MTNTRPKIFDSPMMPAMMKYTSAAHSVVFRVTGGVIGSRFRFGSAFPPWCPRLPAHHPWPYDR